MGFKRPTTLPGRNVIFLLLYLIAKHNSEISLSGYYWYLLYISGNYIHLTTFIDTIVYIDNGKI